ncbi:43932_t:CDS:2, partial [Gigaspora margarita]
TQNIPFEVVNKCKGCALNMLKDSQSYIGHYSKHAIIGAIPHSEKLKKIDQLLVLFSIFENTYRNNKHVGNSELSLEKLETKRIEALIGKIAWNSLTSDTKYKVNPYTISKIIFGNKVEDIGVTRLNLTKGSGLSEVSISTGNQQESKNKDSTLVLK